MKKTTLGLILLFGFIVLIAAAYSYPSSTYIKANSAKKIESTTPTVASTPTPTATPKPSPIATPKPTTNMTIGQKNALAKAKQYLDYSAFSYTGLIGQLEYEGYSTEDATYAVDKCGANWNSQAAKKAKQYLDYSSFSRDGLISQLEYEGFTPEQAEYGVTAVGY